MNRPQICWAWPKQLQESAALRRMLESLGDLRVSTEIPAAGAQCQIYVPHLSHEVSEEVIAQLPELRIIATPSTGTDHIDLRAAARRNIEVLSLRSETAFLESVQSTAELGWMLVLACVRNFRAASEQALTGDYNPLSVRGHELIGKTLGVIGLGRLGTMTARFGQAFRMRVIGADVRNVDLPGVERLGFDEVLRQADIVCVHVHLDESTRNLIDGRALSLMKPGAVLVNTSRGAVVDEKALLDALETGQLSAAGLDVVTGERGDLSSHPVIAYARTHKNLVLTPHAGGCTIEAQTKAYLHIARRLVESWKSIQ